MTFLYLLFIIYCFDIFFYPVFEYPLTSFMTDKKQKSRCILYFPLSWFDSHCMYNWYLYHTAGTQLNAGGSFFFNLVCFVFVCFIHKNYNVKEKLTNKNTAS